MEREVMATAGSLDPIGTLGIQQMPADTRDAALEEARICAGAASQLAFWAQRTPDGGTSPGFAACAQAWAATSQAWSAIAALYPQPRAALTKVTRKPRGY